METKGKYSIFYYIGLGILFLYASLIFGSLTSLLFRIPLSFYTAPISWLIFLGLNPLFLKWYADFSWRKAFGISILSSSVLFSCLFALSHYHETLFDAIWYHHDAVYNLAKGWNPFERYLDKEETAYCQIYLNHFPVGNWVYGASVYLFSNTIEAAKGITLALIFATSFILCGGLISQNFGWSKSRSFVIGILIALNPIALLNVFSFYVDGPLAEIFSLGIVFVLVQILGKDKKVWFAGFVCFAILAHIKLTGTAYAALSMIVFASLILWKFRSEWLKWLLRFSFFVILVVGIWGYHPFVTNTIDKGHPFFPAVENPEVNFFSESNYPANFLGLNRFQKFFISLYSESGWVRTPDKTVFKAPFTFNGLGNYGNGIPDIGAFGPIFQEAFTLAFLIFLLGFFLVKDKKYLVFLFSLSILFVISFFINKEAYIFRYIPHFWILTILFASVLWEVPRWKWLSFICLLALFFNIYRMEVKVISSVNEKTNKINEYLDLLRGKENVYAIDFGWASSFKKRLGENRIDTTNLVWISPTDTPFTEIPGSLGGKFKLRRALLAQ
jgi:hypothetical protein